MGSYQWYLTKKREDLIEQLAKIPDDAMRDLSEVLEEALADHVKKKLKTHNPQTAIDDFKDPMFRALPNIWGIKSPRDFKELSSETTREILSQCEHVGYMARKRLEARGVR